MRERERDTREIRERYERDTLIFTRAAAVLVECLLVGFRAAVLKKSSIP